MKAGIEKLQQLAAERGYTLDYLTCGSPIFQVKNLYTFTSDSIRLAHAVEEQNIECLVDLCSGSGVVGLEVVGTRSVKNAYLVELQSELAKAAKLSSEYNGNETNITVLDADVKNLHNLLPDGVADAVTCNPPYFKSGSGDVPENLSRAMARHEITLSLLDVITEAARLLKPDGKFYLIHIASRLNEIKKELVRAGFSIEQIDTLSGKLERVIIISKKN